MENIIPFPESVKRPEDLLSNMAGSNKIFCGYYDQEEKLNLFIGADLEYKDILFLIDSIRRTMDKIYPPN